MTLPTDQKVGGSSPFEHAKQVRRSGPPNRFDQPAHKGCVSIGYACVRLVACILHNEVCNA